MTSTLFAAARQLAFGGAFDGIDAARDAVNAYVAENGIEVDRDGYVSDEDYADIVAELKG